MQLILNEIDHAIDSGLYYLGLASALTLPDICAALESANGQTTKSLFIEWYDKNMATRFHHLTANDFYSLRCGVIHQGKMGHAKMQYSRVLFTIPNSQNNIFHDNVINDALNLDVTIFCRDIVDCVKTWLIANSNHPNIIKNLPLTVQPRPQGLAPYMVGMPLIA